MRLLLLTLIIWVGGYSFCLEAKDTFFSRYNFYHLTEEAGLPNNSVTSVIKDSYGYVWIATQDGLARYDGYRFLTYGVEKALYRLKGDYVYAVCEDRYKRLWVGSGAGLDLIDLQTGMPLSLSRLGGEEFPELSALFASFVRSVVQASNGDVWVVTDKMLWCLELGDDGKITGCYRMQGQPDNSISAVAELEGGLCAGIGNQLYWIMKKAAMCSKSSCFRMTLCLSAMTGVFPVCRWMVISYG